MIKTNWSTGKTEFEYLSGYRVDRECKKTSSKVNAADDDHNRVEHNQYPNPTGNESYTPRVTSVIAQYANKSML